MRGARRVRQALVSAHPQSVQCADDAGRLPLHCLCEGTSGSEPRVRALLRTFPAAARQSRPPPRRRWMLAMHTSF
jgi:hypothetical protein